MVAKGLDIKKIVIGKPCTPADATNTGYVSALNLAAFATQGYKEMGWNAGVMTW
jgi:chitinase